MSTIRILNISRKDFYTEHKTQNPLKKIDINAILYDTYSTIVISQSYKNLTDNPQEVSFELMLSSNTVLHSFTAKMNNQIYKSKIYDKETAKEKYSDSIASGNTGILTELDELDEDQLNVLIGNIQPGEELQLDVELIAEVNSEDLSYKFFLPLFHIPKLILDKEIVPLSSRFRKGGSLKNISEEACIPIIFSAQYLSPSKITRFTCISHINSQIKFSKDNLTAQIVIDSENIFSSKSSEISILFRNEDVNAPRLYEEFDPSLGMYSYLLRYKVDERTSYKSDQIADTDPIIIYYDNYERNEINETPSSFIFLLDQSGSMAGHYIETAKEALKVFIKSLPADSEFSVIGFGGTYKDYFNILQYNQKNVDKALSLISTLKADLGGTNIFTPLSYVFKNVKSFRKNYPKNLFLLTDGCVEDSSKCIELISKNNNTFRVHSFGIGTGVSSNFIIGCGEAGKGTSSFARDVKEITSKVINSLNCALKDYYSNLEINFSCKFKTELDYPNKKSINIIYQDEVLSYSFITKEKVPNDALVTISADTGLKIKNLV